MPELGRAQIAVYGALAVAVLLLGARAIRESDPSPGPREPPGEAESFELSAAGGRDVVVHVAGAVREPGVYRLPSGSRVTDAVRRAGGESDRAALDSVNLAARLADGQQVVVPERAPAGTAFATSAAVGAEGPISLGAATLAQLDTIEGIGPVTAQKIIEFRDSRGGLSSVEQLDQVSGIGPATMQSLRSRLQP